MIEKYNKMNSLTIDGKKVVTQKDKSGETKDVFHSTIYRRKVDVETDDDICKELLSYFSLLPLRTGRQRFSEGEVILAHTEEYSDGKLEIVYSFYISINDTPISIEDLKEYFKKMYNC